MEMAISLISATVAVASVVFAYFQTRAAKDALRQASLLGLFQMFDHANEATLQDPELLFHVHGLPRTLGVDEAKRIAYFSLLLDGFQHFYGQLFSDDYRKMVTELRHKSVFLNRILGVQENKVRWEHLKRIYYGDFDKEFIAAIDSLFDYELTKTAEHAPPRDAVPAVRPPRP